MRFGVAGAGFSGAVIESVACVESSQKSLVTSS